jgi:hypothetical protein
MAVVKSVEALSRITYHASLVTEHGTRNTQYASLVTHSTLVTHY